jgi:hypothetical protein
MLVPVGVSADRRWFHLQVHGYPFTAYQAWSSSDLVEWEPWSPQIFTDEYGRGFGRQPYHHADPARFFRFAPGGR